MMVEGIGDMRAVDERKKSGSGPVGQIGVPAFGSAHSLWNCIKVQAGNFSTSAHFPDDLKGALLQE